MGMCKSAFEAIYSIYLQPPTHTFPHVHGHRPPTWTTTTYLDNHHLVGQPPPTWTTTTYFVILRLLDTPTYLVTLYLLGHTPHTYLPLTHLFTTYSPTHSFTLSLIHLPIHSFIHPHTACPHTYSPPNIPTYLLIHSPSHSSTLSPIHLPSHSPTYLPFYLLTPCPHPPTHPLTLAHSLFHYFPEID